MKRNVLLTLGILLLVALAWLGWKTSRAGYEGPDYEIVASHGDVEIRRYEDMIGAATGMGGATGNEGERNSGFGRLFRYITGANEREEKIAMTSPVFVETDNQAREGTMIFLMPRQTIEAGVPAPSGEAVSVRPIDGGLFAALRFHGYRSKESQRAALTEIRETVTAAGLEPVGEPFFAFYDPPWIPEFLRRNEVLVRVEEATERSPD